MNKTIIFLLLIFLSGFKGFSQNLQTENIFIITLDGFRWQELYTGADSALITNKEYVKDPLGLKGQFWAETGEQRRELLTPFFWKVIAKEGQLYGNRNFGNNVNCTNHMWFSYPGYSEILCGFSDDERIKSNNKIDNPNVTVLEFLNKQPGFTGKVAAFGSWDVFPYIINEKRSGIPVNAGFEKANGRKLSDREIFLNDLQDEIPSPWGSVRLDAFTHHFALEYIKKNKPKVVYISYGETDDFAHDGKYDAYLRSAHQTDKFIEDLWNWVQSNSRYKNKTTFIITTDHGRGTVPLDTWRSHGTDIHDADQIWFAVIGPNTPPLGEIKNPGQYYQSQVANTAATFLGVKYSNEKKVGDPVMSMIKK
jgi:hypothetical protein